MAAKLNKAGYDYAVKLIKNGLEVEHDTNNWDEVKPTRDEIVRYLKAHSLDEYGMWFLGIKSDVDAKDAAKFIYPFGDLSVLHQSALLVAQQESAKNNDAEIKSAVEKLLAMIKQTKK